MTDVISLLSSFTIFGWLYLTLGIVLLIPASVLVKNYRRTSVHDFLIFAGIFLAYAIGVLGIPFYAHLGDPTLWKLNNLGLIYAHFFLFLHTVRLLWSKPPVIIWYTGLILFFSSQLFYIVFPTAQYSRDLINLIAVFLRELHRIFSSLLTIYAYKSIQPVNPTVRIRRCISLWIIASGLLASIGFIVIITFVLQDVPETGILAILPSLLIFLAGAITGYVAIRFPESMLISHVQLIRAAKLYKLVRGKTPSGLGEVISEEALTLYLRSIPADIFQDI